MELYIFQIKKGNVLGFINDYDQINNNIKIFRAETWDRVLKEQEIDKNLFFKEKNDKGKEVDKRILACMSSPMAAAFHDKIKDVLVTKGPEYACYIRRVRAPTNINKIIRYIKL